MDRGHEETAMLNGGGYGMEDGMVGGYGDRVKHLPTSAYVFWGAAWAVLLGGIVGLLSTMMGPVWEGGIYDLVDNIYLILFGVIMVILDAPLNFAGIVTWQTLVHKYCKALQLFTGRGIWYIFLGCMVFFTLWDNNEWGFGGLILGVYVFVVGGCSTVLGILKSNKLEKAREEVKRKGESQLRALHRYYARKFPHEGLTPDEFNQLTTQTAGLTFDANDLDYIFGALSSNRSCISQNDLYEWVTGQFMTLL
jgi:hypothetical protein